MKSRDILGLDEAVHGMTRAEVIEFIRANTLIPVSAGGGHNYPIGVPISPKEQNKGAHIAYNTLNPAQSAITNLTRGGNTINFRYLGVDSTSIDMTKKLYQQVEKRMKSLESHYRYLGKKIEIMKKKRRKNVTDEELKAFIIQDEFDLTAKNLKKLKEILEGKF